MPFGAVRSLLWTVWSETELWVSPSWLSRRCNRCEAKRAHVWEVFEHGTSVYKRCFRNTYTHVSKDVLLAGAANFPLATGVVVEADSFGFDFPEILDEETRADIEDAGSRFATR